MTGVFSHTELMQQAKINAYFGPTAATSQLQLKLQAHKIDGSVRSNFDPKASVSANDEASVLKNKDIGEADHGSNVSLSGSSSVNKILNKKRSYAQYHLEFGQSDFVLHSCSVCGLMYARGDEEDEKLHKRYHNEYYHGIQLKGWRNERLVATHRGGDRIILVLDEDPPAHKNKVKDVARAMEKDLGFSHGQLVHSCCKVYLYISSHHIVGCLVAEPITAAFRIIPRSSTNEDPNVANNNCTKSDCLQDAIKDSKALNASTIQFGNISFRREVVRKHSSARNHKVDYSDGGAIFCEEAAVDAVCGIRAIWVVLSSRRKGIASKLIDATRKSFCKDQIVEPSQIAFSAPTSAGKALALSYMGCESFLVYKTDA